MKWYPLVAGLLVFALIAAGCSDLPEEPEDIWPAPTIQEPRYVAGDIVSKIGGQQEEPLWLILDYNNTTDMYERAFVYKKADGTWGYRKDNRIDEYPRIDLESLYRVKVAHVKVALVPIISPGISSTETLPAEAGSAPEITGITPDSGPQDAMVNVEISGRYFVSGVTVSLAGAGSPAIMATDVRNTGTRISCVFNLADAEPGKRDVIVTNPDGQSDVFANGFNVNHQAPSIGGIEPFEGIKGQTLIISITGLNFKSPAQVYFVKGNTELEGGNVQVKNSNLITVAFAIPSDVEAGTWGVIVRNVADAQNSSIIRKFVIRNVT